MKHNRIYIKQTNNNVVTEIQIQYDWIGYFFKKNLVITTKMGKNPI